MSSNCGNCDCADKTNCVKKGNSFGIEIIETKRSYNTMVMDASVGELEGDCKCGANCTCTSCGCGH